MSRRLALHGAALLVLLVLVAPFATAGGLFHADEGAVLSEVRLLVESGDWTTTNPQPDLDPEMEALPLELSERFENGRWAPYLKHPLYPALVRLGDPFGRVGWVLPTILGTVAAAVGAGILSERLRSGTAVPALWATGVATPLLFQSFVVQAHTLAAGAVAVAAVAADRVIADRSARVLVNALATVVFVTLAVAVRTEALFAGLALAGGALVASRFRPYGTALAVVVGGAAVAAWRFEASGLLPAIGGSDPLGSVLAGRATVESGGDPLGAFRLTVLDASFAGGPVVVGAAGALFAWITAFAVRRGMRLVVLGGLAAAFVAFALRATEGGLIPGLLPCTPVLAGLVGLDRNTVGSRTGSLLVSASTLYAAAITMTQYSNGGGATWGGRFFVVGLPLVVPLAVVGWASLVDRLDDLEARALRLVGAAVVLVVGLLAIGSMRDHRDLFDDFVQDIVLARDQAGEPAPVLATTGILPRFAWEHVDEGIWLTAEPEALDRYLERLHERGGEVVLVTFEPELDLEAVEPLYRVADQEGPFVFTLEPL